ncbi:MAG: hypothetical protein IKB05_04880 [Alphaproteobacteria bacterium]|nr:hypothetical protein [Alphaproteobacteria bacterium]
MRHITVSIFAFLLAMPAFADARLPVVNLASAGVSARAAFGESVPTTKQLPKRNVVARPTVQRTATPAKTANMTAATLVTSNDILVPNRPSNDLWAHNSSSLNASVDTPLRMPKPSEFAVYRSDEILPEESLDTSTMPKTYAYNDDAPVAPVAPTRTAAAKKSELDAQIERLVELQRRADESVTPTNVAPRVIARPVVDEPIAPSTDDVRVAVADTTPTETVNVRRMVVPMETRDVVVRSVEKNQSPRIAAVRDDMTKLSPSELRRAFRKTFLSENKHLSTYQMDDSFDVVSDMDTSSGSFTSSRDLSEDAGIRPLEIKINFRNDDASLSRDNYNLLSEYAAIVVHNPTRAIQIAIPARTTTDADARKLTARRLAIVEQVLRDTGVSMQRIVPVLSQRDEAGFVLRVISNEQYESLSQQKRNIFGDTVSSKKYKSLTW